MNNSPVQPSQGMLHLNLIIAPLFVLGLLRLAFAACTKPNVPLDPEVVGRSISAPGRCGRNGKLKRLNVAVEESGIRYHPLHVVKREKRKAWAVCPEEIVAVYRSSEKEAVIYHRPRTGVSYFRRRKPNLAKRYNKGEKSISFPCDIVPVRIVLAWKQRNYYIGLMRKLVAGIKHIRDADLACDDKRTSYRSRKKTSHIIWRFQVANAALNFLHATSYANYFCA